MIPTSQLLFFLWKPLGQDVSDISLPGCCESLTSSLASTHTTALLNKEVDISVCTIFKVNTTLKQRPVPTSRNTPVFYNQCRAPILITSCSSAINDKHTLTAGFDDAFSVSSDSSKCLSDLISIFTLVSATSESDVESNLSIEDIPVDEKSTCSHYLNHLSVTEHSHFLVSQGNGTKTKLHQSSLHPHEKDEKGGIMWVNRAQVWKKMYCYCTHK